MVIKKQLFSIFCWYNLKFPARYIRPNFLTVSVTSLPFSWPFVLYLIGWLISYWKSHYQAQDLVRRSILFLMSWEAACEGKAVIYNLRYFPLRSDFHTRYIMGLFIALLSTKPFEAISLHLGCFLLEMTGLLLESPMQLLMHATVLFQGKWPLYFL